MGARCPSRRGVGPLEPFRRGIVTVDHSTRPRALQPRSSSAQCLAETGPGLAGPPPIYMTATTETRPFEAEVQQVLELVIHSLYANREIFLRELVSNASDALDKLRFEALTDADLMPSDEILGIALSVDKGAGTLTIADNGIGMTHDELVEGLGKIASSGTRRFLEALREQNSQNSPDLIGRFGVGFYSAFMVADQVTVETRKAGTDQGWRWSSAGNGEYTLEEVEGIGRGTVITLHMRATSSDTEGDAEADEDSAEAAGKDATEFLDEWKLRDVIKRYSDFVEYPVQMEVERSEQPKDDEGKPDEDAEAITKKQTDTLNSMQPLWSRPRNEIEEQEYKDFYKHIAKDWQDPLETIHFRAEGTLEYTALLYLPSQRGMDLFDPEQSKSRISLYVRRVLIMPECADLLPGWLRFVRGVVESSDLPLNVSRETLQANSSVGQIQRRLIKKVLESMESLLESDRERYTQFWRAFGQVLKEGIYYGEDNDQRISSISLFETTQGEELTTLAEYIERMPEGQDSIYTIAGRDRETAEASPHLEALREKGFEALLLVDHVDEFVMERFTEFGGKQIQALEKGELDLEDESEKEKRTEKEGEYKDLLSAIQSALDEDISEVRFSSRLKDSPAVLVAGQDGMTPQLERMLRAQGQAVPKQKRVLELNPDHALIGGLKKVFDVDAASPRVGDYGMLLMGQAQLAEGAVPADPGRFAKLLTQLMVDGIGG
ncbi:MAG: molecular chaperone HtpG [Planctomycetota bacterium]